MATLVYLFVQQEPSHDRKIVRSTRILPMSSGRVFEEVPKIYSRRHNLRVTLIA